jgi:hypothetical protein
LDLGPELSTFRSPSLALLDRTLSPSTSSGESTTQQEEEKKQARGKDKKRKSKRRTSSGDTGTQLSCSMRVVRP